MSPTQSDKRVLSGIQPTGNLHIGNYLGAIKNWVRMQDDYECLFCIVDLHALTIPQDPKELYESTLSVAAAYIASGIHPENNILFNQAQVPGHSELAWLLGCHTPIGWLNRMTQFKDKAGKNREKAGLGLYAYPVLMAADILLYKATHVPVGEDQKQHVELTRDIAQSFNSRFGIDYFTLPDPTILGHATRVMSLRDGSKKMSKSDPSDFSRILLSDDPDTIAQKIRKAKTDPEPLPPTVEGLEGRPEAKNLMTIYAALGNQPMDEICAHFAGKNFSDFKQILADQLIAELEPIRLKMLDLLSDKAELEKILRQGAEKANQIAHQTVAEVQDILGLLH